VMVSQSMHQADAYLSKADWHDIERFSSGQAGYAFCQTALRLFVGLLVRHKTFSKLTGLEQALLIRRVLQGRSVPDITKQLELNGKAAIEQGLRQAVAQLILFAAEDNIVITSE